MSDTRRLLDAANALSTLLRARGVPHAFYGSALPAALANQPHADVSHPPFVIPLISHPQQEISCIVEGGQHQAHPFRRAREAVAASNDFTVVQSPWTNRYLFPILL